MTLKLDCMLTFCFLVGYATTQCHDCADDGWSTEERGGGCEERVVRVLDS